MNAKDLMIGNYILANGDITKVVQLDIGGKSFCEINNIKVHKLTGAEINNHKVIFEPIQLTEEILLKCGFEKTKTMDYRINNNEFYDFLLMRIGFEYSFFQERRDNEEVQLLRRITFFHELQNLYYLLTKKELEINF